MNPRSAVRVFVSYAHEDREFVERLVDDLREQGADLFYDRLSIQPGESIVRRVSAELDASDYILVVLSHASIDSGWVNAELDAAFMRECDARTTLILPVIFSDVAVPTLLRPRRAADFRGDYSAGLNSLLRVLSLPDRLVAAETRDPTLERTSLEDDVQVRVNRLRRLRFVDLYRLVARRLDRNQLQILWSEVLDEDVDLDPNAFTSEVAVDLVFAVRDRARLDDLLSAIAMLHPDLIEDASS